jgi:hypothetical protein
MASHPGDDLWGQAYSHEQIPYYSANDAHRWLMPRLPRALVRLWISSLPEKFMRSPPFIHIGSCLNEHKTVLCFNREVII